MRLLSRIAGRVQRTAVQWQPFLIKARGEAWLQNQAGRGAYRNLSEAEILATPRTEILFIFGSGYSINEISAAEWAHIEAHDTLSFNWFIHQDHVRADYHLVREVSPFDADRRIWEPSLREYADLIRRNGRYANAIFLVQGGWRTINGNRIVGLRMLPAGARVFRFTNRSRDRYESPSESFSAGLVHSASTAGDCVNFGYIMGWRHIVLVGVDMYDNRYFWLGQNEERASIAAARPGLGVNDPFPTARHIIDVLARWRTYLEARGVALSVYNPRSLLAEVLPTYDSPARVPGTVSRS